MEKAHTEENVQQLEEHSAYVPRSSGRRSSPQYIKKQALDYKIMIVDVSTQGQEVQIESGDFDQYIGEYETKIMRNGLLLSAREARSVLYYTNRYVSRAVQANLEQEAVSRYMSSAYMRIRTQEEEEKEHSQRFSNVSSTQTAKNDNHAQKEYISEAYKRTIVKHRQE